MSPSICSCVLCGDDIVNWLDTPSWQNEFRGLYSGPEGIVLTGLGVYDDPGRGAWTAPPNTNTSWDNYEPSDDDTFGANQQGSRNSRHGFVFHGACWALLEKCLEPDLVPRPRLLEVLNSLPFPLGSTAIDWGHNYGRLSMFNGEDYYPWENLKLHAEIPEPELEVVTDRCNPHDISAGIATLLALVPDHEEAPPQIHSLDNKGDGPETGAVKANGDCFFRLPVELCLAIASCLPTPDVLHARMASRAFWPIFHDQQFWQTRFQPGGGGDRRWLFELRGEPRLDWRWLHRQTHPSRLSPALSNRRRVWTLVEHVVRILDLRSHGLMSPLPSNPENQSCSAPQSDVNKQLTDALITVSGNLTHLKPDQARSHFTNGCRIFYKCRIHIPKSINKVTICPVNLGGTYYIAGLIFTSSSGDVIQAGYNSKYHATDSVEVSGLCGFQVALGAKGLYGLRCIVEGGKQSRWLGNIDESLRTDRLACYASLLEELELGFDGCKLTSMAVYLPAPPKETLPKDDSLRSTALWYPELPSSSMDLNESSFIPLARSPQRYMSGFQPLVITHFGGQDGKYLRHLTGIKAEGWPAVCRIHFCYDNGVHVPPLGRVTFEHSPRVLDFPLDGPGGEAIVAMDVVYVTHFYSSVGYWTQLICCEMTTNRGRSCSFPPGKEPPEPNPQSTIDIIHISATPGTMITALYGTQSPENGMGLNTLGVITEKCDLAGFE